MADTKPETKKPTEVSKAKKDPKLKNIHGIVNHTGVKVGASIFMLLVIGGCSYASYRFVDLSYKSTEEYVGLGFMWIGVLVFLYFLVKELILKDDLFNLLSELYHYENTMYYFLIFVAFCFFVTLTLMIVSNATQSNPMNLDYQRHCPEGTTYGKNYKPPEDLS